MTLSIDEARRLALTAQGFGAPRPARPAARHLAALIRRLGLLQLDFVNVLVPSHYLVPFSRLGPYNRAAPRSRRVRRTRVHRAVGARSLHHSRGNVAPAAAPARHPHRAPVGLRRRSWRGTTSTWRRRSAKSGSAGRSAPPTCPTRRTQAGGFPESWYGSVPARCSRRASAAASSPSPRGAKTSRACSTWPSASFPSSTTTGSSTGTSPSASCCASPRGRAGWEPRPIWRTTSA